MLRRLAEHVAAGSTAAASSPSVVPLATDDDSLEVVGGKGRSLSQLSHAGFTVPTGFLVTAAAYRAHIVAHDLQGRIVELATNPEILDGVLSFEAASAAIVALFEATSLSEALIDEIAGAYDGLQGGPPLAVRSSANAEDLPGLSFAGQHSSYLNVRGSAEIVVAVKNCWASLWTAQAMAYRHKNGVDHNAVAMAVVAQVMVPSEISGIMFTANPATGARGEIIINASFGLGEAVVSGQVTPDTYTVDRTTGEISTDIGAKMQRIVSDGEQGVRMEDIEEASRGTSSLSDEQVAELVSRAKEIESIFETGPQDIEWGYSDGVLHLLQSRPITNLPPPPLLDVDWTPPFPAKEMIRRQIVENMPDPLCPLFEELYLIDGQQEGLRRASVRRAAKAGTPDTWWPWTQQMDGPHYMTANGYAYQRLEFKFTWPKEESIASAAAFKASDGWSPELEARLEGVGTGEGRRNWEAVEPLPSQDEMAMHDLTLFVDSLNEQEKATFEKVHAATLADSETDGDAAILLTMAHNVSTEATFMANNKIMTNERTIASWESESLPDLLQMTQEWAAVDVATASDATLMEGIRMLAVEEGAYWATDAGHTFGVGKSTDDHLQMQANDDLAAIADEIKQSPKLSAMIATASNLQLMQLLRETPEASAVLEKIMAYLHTYGHQGYSLDFVEPTQIEDPSALFTSLQAMVRDADYDPEASYGIAAERKATAMREITEVLGKETLAYWQFRYRLWFASRYYPVREETVFYLGSAWPVLRPLALELGRRFVEAGTLKSARGIFFLTPQEIEEAMAARANGDGLPELAAAAIERDELREARKRVHPPGSLPPDVGDHNAGLRYKETQKMNDEDSEVLNGFPVSPGTVVGEASLVLDAQHFAEMKPNTILVCPMTSPAWTQLFAHATGLVTDMGSILAHGSIVAREYGIPAVLGTGNCTQRIKSGDIIAVDGDDGTVHILEQSP